MSSLSLKDTLQNYTLESLNLNLWDISQMSSEELKNQIQIHLKEEFSQLSAEEIEDFIQNAQNEMSNKLDEVSEYLEELKESPLEDPNQPYNFTDSATPLVNELEMFLMNDSLSLLEMNTEVILPELNRLMGLGKSTDEDLYFKYNQTPENTVYGGEVVKIDLLGVPEEILESQKSLPNDSDSDQIPDTDINGDGRIDAADLTFKKAKDPSFQNFYLEINLGDEILSTSFDETSNTLFLEMETRDPLNPEAGSHTFMIEIHLSDLENTQIHLNGENFSASQSVFKDLPQNVLDIIFENNSSVSIGENFNPLANDPELNEQLRAIAGYSDCVDNIPSRLSTFQSAFSSDLSLPNDAAQILEEMFQTSFDTSLLNSYSTKTYEETLQSFSDLLSAYSPAEQSSLAQAFSFIFISHAPEEFSQIMLGVGPTLQNFINADLASTSTLSASQIASHTLIESTLGYGIYSGDSSLGDLFTNGQAFATNFGEDGEWSNSNKNIDALNFLIDQGFDASGIMAQATDFENSILEGQISTQEATSLSAAFGQIKLDNLYTKGQIDLKTKDWEDGIQYLSDHLLDADLNLVDDPLSVFKECIAKFFTNKNGELSNGADNFASTFLYACDLKLSKGSGIEALMSGPNGTGIADYLWQITNNQGTKPKFYDEALKFKNSLTQT